MCAPARGDHADPGRQDVRVRQRHVGRQAEPALLDADRKAAGGHDGLRRRLLRAVLQRSAPTPRNAHRARRPTRSPASSCKPGSMPGGRRWTEGRALVVGRLRSVGVRERHPSSGGCASSSGGKSARRREAAPRRFAQDSPARGSLRASDSPCTQSGACLRPERLPEVCRTSPASSRTLAPPQGAPASGALRQSRPCDPRHASGRRASRVRAHTWSDDR